MNIVVVGTLDTKGEEVGYIRDRITRLGHTPLVVDTGILGKPGIAADISRDQVALEGGEALAKLIARRDKAHAQDVMIRGLVSIVSELNARGQLQGIIAVGGAQGTSLATAAMRALPVGIPKVMVSTVACGKTTFGPFVGTKDVTMIHSVADIAGLNRVTRRILAQAAEAVVAMACVLPEEDTGRKLIAITQAGITTPGVTAVKSTLEEMGFEVIVFHCNGIGGKAMEDLILDGSVSGVIDYTPHEVTDLLFDGLMPALPGRLTAAGLRGIPQVVAPGATDIILHSPLPELSPELAKRRWTIHSPLHCHVRANGSEMAAVAHFIAERLNQGRGPRACLIPLQGFSMLNRVGEVLYDPDADMRYVETMRRELSPAVEQIEVDAHINDPIFAQATVETFLRLYRSSATAGSSLDRSPLGEEQP